MCTVLLPPDDNPTAVNKYIISYIETSGIVVKKRRSGSLLRPSHSHARYHSICLQNIIFFVTS